MAITHYECIRGTTGIAQGDFFANTDRNTLAGALHRLPNAHVVRVQSKQTSCTQESIHRCRGGNEGQSENVASQRLNVFSLQTAQGNQVNGDIPKYRSPGNDSAVSLDCGDVDETTFGKRTLRVALLFLLDILGEDLKLGVVPARG